MLRRVLLLAAAVASSLAAADFASSNEVRAVLQEGASLTADEAAALEAQLEDDPLDMSARTRLLGYYGKRLRQREPTSEARWRSLVLWLIHTEPKSAVLSAPPSPLLEFNRFLKPEEYVEGKRAFLAHLEKEPDDLTLLEHTADFVSFRDRTLAAELTERARSLDSSNPKWAIGLALGHYNTYRDSLRGSGASNVEAAREALAELEGAFKLSDDDTRVEGFLQLAAEVAVVANEIDKAREYAYLMLDSDRHGSRHYGDYVHYGNITLGKISLAQGDVQGAASYLLLAASMPGSQRLNGMGPDMTLAKELLENGERESVLQYFEQCARFWERGQDRLREWAVLVQAGSTPSFRPY